MPKNSFQIALAAVLVLVIAGLVWWKFFGPTPEQKFLREIKKTVTLVNEGSHGAVADKFSPEFIRFLGEQGFQPQQIILLVRQIDINQNAQYALHKLSLFEPGRFAEVEFTRKSSDGEQLFTLPFVYRGGQWWLTDHFESKKTWDFPSL